MPRVLFTFLPFFFLLYAGDIFRNTRQVEPLAMYDDGPYVFYKNKRVVAQYIDDNKGIRTIRADSVAASQKGSLELRVRTDIEGKEFTVRLKKKVEDEEPEFRNVSHMFVISDIEGNFAAFRKLLQGNGIIDNDFNWTFGTGHLVLTGDFFDRGDKVTEILWLIYALEAKAQAAGGYVHFILGNHEIMNLSADLRYVNTKYTENALLLNKSYTALFGEDTELGRWLRSKNVVEKIGDILFVHGGISAQLNREELPVKRVNKLARPYYADSLANYPDAQVDMLFGEFGPLWYRGYYAGKPIATVSQLDSTLAFYRAKHIATGHTVISDTIRVLHGGKLFNTDVHHLKGHSEGLWVEEGKFYRADNTGRKFLIFQK